MVSVDELKAIGHKLWPEAANIDIERANRGKGGSAGFLLAAIHSDGSIIEQIFADNLDNLAVSLGILRQDNAD
jgi:hypothetical protein